MTNAAADNAALDVATLRNDARQGEQLVRRVHEFLGRFVAFPSNEAHVAVSLWVIHAHLIERWESTPRLAFLSAEPASGKTRALEILELLVPRPISPVNASPYAPHVADVADVAEFPGAASQARQCAQCNADDDGQLIKFGDVYLHKECKPFWFGQR